MSPTMPRTVTSRVLSFLAALTLTACATPPAGPIMRDTPQARLARTFTASEIEADLRHLAATVRRTAPEGSLAISEADAAALVARQMTRLSHGGTRRDILPAAMRITGAHQSAHVYVVLPHEDWNRAAAAGERLIVEAMELRGDGLHLRDGRKVIAIGDHSAADFVAWHRDAYDTHNPLRRAARFRERSATALWAWGAPRDAWLLVEAADGGTEKVEPATAPLEPRRSLFDRGDARGSSAPPRIGMTEGSRPGTIVLLAPTFDPRSDGEWAAVVDALEARIAAGTVAHLVVDLRGNGGGTGRIGASLLQAIAGRQVAQSGGKRWRRSPEYEAAIAELVPIWLRWAPWRRRLLGEDGVATLDAIPIGGTATVGAPQDAFDAGLRARVRTTVLIDGAVASSATQFARAVQFHELGELVGAPTADSTSGLGEIAFFRMPNTGLVFASPSAEFVDLSGQPIDGPVMPDRLICASDTPSFAPEFALEAATDAPNVRWRTMTEPAFRRDLGEADYCALRD